MASALVTQLRSFFTSLCFKRTSPFTSSLRSSSLSRCFAHTSLSPLIKMRSEATNRASLGWAFGPGGWKPPSNWRSQSGAKAIRAPSRSTFSDRPAPICKAILLLKLLQNGSLKPMLSPIQICPKPVANALENTMHPTNIRRQISCIIAVFSGHFSVVFQF